MAKKNGPKPYLNRIKNWKVRNMVMLYLEAREHFLECRKLLKKNVSVSFDKMRKICDILYEIKEDHHLVFKRLIDPKKSKFEEAHKFMPSDIEAQFMNNIGLLFHKVMVVRELKYVMDHYVEGSESFQKNRESLNYHMRMIDDLFKEGIKILKSLIGQHRDNILLLTLLLEDPDRTRKHFGQEAREIIEQFANGKGLGEVYYAVGEFYADNGWKDKAAKMLEEALRKNPRHRKARNRLVSLNGRYLAEAQEV